MDRNSAMLLVWDEGYNHYVGPYILVVFVYSSLFHWVLFLSFRSPVKCNIYENSIRTRACASTGHTPGMVIF